MNSYVEKRRWGFEIYQLVEAGEANRLLGQPVTQEEWDRIMKQKLGPNLAYHLYYGELISEQDFRRLYQEVADLFIDLERSL